MNRPADLPAQSAVRVVVLGSINMDLVVRTPAMPRPGETLRGRDFLTVPGGKGANQAVAAARLGARCDMVGRVGDDAFGRDLLNNLEHEKVNTDAVATTARTPSGVAVILVDDLGENAITIVAGANGRLTPEDAVAAESLIAGADALLLQLEVPLETVARAAEIARRHGVMTVLDPAPAPTADHPLPPALFAVDLISPNQSEAELLTGEPVQGVAEAKLVGAELVRRGAGRAVIKLGEQGAVLVDRDERVEHVASFAVQVADTTAAGDAFTAGLAVALADGLDAADAVRVGCAAGALATTAVGAQAALPTRREVRQLLRRGA